jgi:hypothetical protein
MKRILIAGVSLGLSCLVSSAAEPGDWELRRDRDAIQIYTRKIDDSPYDAVRSVTVVEGVRVSSMIALLEDAEACPDWADRCAESRVHTRIAPNESLVYTVNDMPFPVKDRDVLAHVTWSQDPESLTVTMSSYATEGQLEPVKGRLRLTEARVTWQFRPLPSGAVEVMSEAHINPGSPLPGFVTNMLLVDTPYETLRAFREAIHRPEYAAVSYDFVQEP